MRDAVGKFVLAALQIGSGASLGREGPTVQICAGITSLLGKLGRLSRQNRRRMASVGVAAGIAAAFNAPIAAVTFTLEEVIGDLDQTILSGVIVAAALAAVVERTILGTHPVLEVLRSYSLVSASSLLWYAVLGCLSALVSVAFTDSLLHLRGWFKRFTAVPKWAHPGIGGAVTGLIAVIALGWLHTGGVTGGGYSTLGVALLGSLPLRVMIGLCVLKLVATVFSYSSGGVGGIFAPALFIGAMLGGTIGYLDVTLLHHASDEIGAFAVVGMGAVFAGIIRAPMTSVLIIFEMTGGYGLVLPLMVANMSAYALARHWRHTPIYEALLEQDGVELPRNKAVIDEPVEVQQGEQLP
jgi:CIC family chloride channel protein